ncbi:hypothetical protein JOD31_000071 [Methylopila capsulata]|nr:hypothetical protein [Methylopila capsulata]MBM7849859.1 hypothetical protein [Methylopila capsulata]
MAETALRRNTGERRDNRNAAVCVSPDTSLNAPRGGSFEMRAASLIAGLFCVLAGSTVHAQDLAGDALSETIAGRTVYLATPLGGEFPLNYRKDGVVDGSGDAVGLGRFMQPKDSGRWWVDGPKLCQKWRTWYDGKAFCFTVASLGGDKIAWVRDDGLKGTARIAR